MSIFNFSFGNKRTPSQLDLGRTGSSVNHFYGTGIGYTIDEFNLYSQIKDYRTDLLNGTNWRATDISNSTNFQYIQFLKIYYIINTIIVFQKGEKCFNNFYESP